MSLVNDIKPNVYGPEYQEHLFEQYKMLVKSADNISERRNSANNLYLGLNTGLVTLVGLSFNISGLAWIRPFVYAVALILSILMWFLINSYKQLNTGKFKVIHEIEQQLPLSIYEYEWEVLGKGKDLKKYFPFSHIEVKIPLVLGGLYLLLLGSCIYEQVQIILANICIR